MRLFVRLKQLIDKGVTYVTPKPCCYGDLVTPVSYAKSECDRCPWLPDCWEKLENVTNELRRTHV